MTVSDVHYKSDKSDWGTPDKFFQKLDAEFGFELDVCATIENAKCDIFISEGSLEKQWNLENVKTAWMNPPYGRKITELWVSKAYEQSEFVKVVCLLPARTDTKWWAIFWDYDLHKAKPGVEVRFIKGRLKFKGAPTSAPFPSVIVVMDRR